MNESQKAANSIPAARPPALSGTGLTALIILMWLLSFTVYRVPGSDPLAGEVGPVTVAKAMVRVGALGALLVLIAGSPALAARRRVLRRLAPLAIFATWCAISAIWSAEPQFSLGQAIFLASLIALAATVGLASVHDEQFLRVIKHATAICLFVTALNIVAAYAFPGKTVGDRPAALMHPNSAAQIAGLGVLLLVSARLIWKPRWALMWLIPGIIVAVYVLILMHSRTAILATGLCMAAALFLFGPRKSVVTCFVAGTVLLAAYLMIDPDYSLAKESFTGLRSFMLRGQTPTQLRQATGRTEMWRVGYEAWRESPVIGHGNYMMTESGKATVWGEEQAQTAHNLILHVLGGTGIIGLFLMLAGWAVPGILAWRSAISRSPRRYAAAMVLIFYAWYFMVGMYELSFAQQVSPITVLFFALTGVACGRLKPHEHFVRKAIPLRPKSDTAETPA